MAWMVYLSLLTQMISVLQSHTHLVHCTLSSPIPGQLVEDPEYIMLQIVLPYISCNTEGTKLPLDQVLDYITLFAFTGELGQRAILHQYSLEIIPQAFASLAPPEFRAQTVEEAVSDSRRYRAMICNGSCWTQTRVRSKDRL